MCVSEMGRREKKEGSGDLLKFKGEGGWCTHFPGLRLFRHGGSTLASQKWRWTRAGAGGRMEGRRQTRPLHSPGWGLEGLSTPPQAC